MISKRFFPRAWRTLAVLVSLTVPSTLAVAGEHPDTTPQTGWKSLFNGTNLSGWASVTQDGQPADPNAWVVEDGALTRHPNKYHKPMNWLADQSGYIWLQDHPGEIWFRNIWVKPLDNAG